MATVKTIVEEEISTLQSVNAAGGEGGPAVSWGAIIAGATASAALSLILLVLGMGLGLSAVSPWAGNGSQAEAITWSTIIWICCMAFAASGLGGYIAGRLRSRWFSASLDEVYFRDTAHGFLAWALATLLTAAALTSVIGTILGTAGPAPTRPTTDMRTAYVVDMLFRPAPGPAAPTAAPETGTSAPAAPSMGSREEIGRILDTSLEGGALPPEDARYVAQLLSRGTGLSPEQAEQRVIDTYGAAQTRQQEAEERARELADEARRNAAHASLWIFVSLLLGAFTSSLMATFGGRQRDN